ncbi:Asparagine synthetase [glutamine-hydrolyzing] 1 [Halomicronema hongdechloris C2206]|uniref:asparagine synthase (glutamine-hydrolyzing) n=1 Tax=Halomicronema hongdechloris C2206 TaxID=1641165 RepID=A0A1Z3HKH7_9CYAN|nr:asparagine synthase (glutamine-hydrolyzing) [Halomicronema hongdechloris]ASC70824.1 Asparagine synthetase [glutamine-hydrolyzing] 1 [Halomicronema hongdechloris C2206]
MCGLVAVLSSGQSLEDRLPLIDRMLASLFHRGPDGRGVKHIPGQALLGHQRLAIIDAEHGAQPMSSSNGRYSLIFNGEIYNYLELRQSLIQQGERFETFSDTEVLLKLLIRDGAAAIDRLNGMFAFIFHDRLENKWITARDPFGIKPLYYAHCQEELLFASEIKALLLHPEIAASRDNQALHQYLCFQFCLDDHTLFEGIKKIRPGSYLLGQGDQIKKEIIYWDTNYQIDQYHTEDYFLDRLSSLLEDTLRLQIRSDVPLGGYLSGGIDSSLICTLAAQHLETSFPMFHGRFAEGLAYDESKYARIVSANSSGQYFETVPTAKQFVESLPYLIYMLDEPLAGPGLFPQFAVSKLAKEQVTVVLGGQGGDEIFGGYARYLVGYLEQALKGAIFETQEEGKHVVTLESIIPHLSILKQYKPLLANFWSRGLFEPMDARYFHLIDRSQGMMRLLNPEILAGFDRTALFADFQAIFNHPDTQSYINKMTHFDQKTLLPALLQIEDRVSMAVSLESRVPLLDTRIVDLITTMPPPMKFKGGRTKHILKKAIRHILPPEILNRKDKMGFPVPLKEWMKGGCVRDFVGDTLLSQHSLNRGIFRPEALEAMMSDQGVGGRQLWGALCLELWHRQFIDSN